MTSISETTWDVVLAGTGLQQSLLALALSRSGKKVLHIDQNDYYGGAEAALTLQEAEDWVKWVNESPPLSLYHDASLDKPDRDFDPAEDHLGSSRAYSLSLSPKIIFTRSNLLPALVSSKVHEQLEFLAVGTWWAFISQRSEEFENTELNSEASIHCRDRPVPLRKIPGSREDIFVDEALPLRAKRSLIKLLKLTADSEEHFRIAGQYGDLPFPNFLGEEYHIPTNLQAMLHALTLSPDPPDRISTSLALRNIHRHVTSISLFGPGFSSVVPKWGGLSEIAQVGCRAGAVGGGVYVLGKGVEDIDRINDVPDDSSDGEGGHGQNTEGSLSVKLNSGETVRTRWLVGTPDDLPPTTDSNPNFRGTCHSISIVASSLSSLFPPPKEGAPPPAASVVVFPSGSLPVGARHENFEAPPVYVTVHSADTGECPAGQCLLYAQTQASPQAGKLLKIAVDGLLISTNTPLTLVPFTLKYTRAFRLPSQSSLDQAQKEDSAAFTPTCDAGDVRDADPTSKHASSRIITFPSLNAESSSSSIALEDSVLHSVRAAWERITANDDPGSRGRFMVFPERESEGNGDGDNQRGSELDDDGQALHESGVRAEAVQTEFMSDRKSA